MTESLDERSDRLVTIATVCTCLNIGCNLLVSVIIRPYVLDLNLGMIPYIGLLFLLRGIIILHAWIRLHRWMSGEHAINLLFTITLSGLSTGFFTYHDTNSAFHRGYTLPMIFK